MNRIGWVGVISGALAGIIGAILVSSYDLSIFSVAVIGAVIGILVGYFGRKK